MAGGDSFPAVILVDEVRPDVAHVHNTWYSLSPAVVRVLRGAGVPVVMTLRIPPNREATTGVPHAIASIAVIPNGSNSEGSVNISA